MGAFAVVGERSVVEDGAVLHSHVYVGPDCQVGEESVLHPHVVLRERRGARPPRGRPPGRVLGADGFGYVFDGQAHRKIPQVGGVVVEDDVEIGANTTIDRATLGETRDRPGHEDRQPRADRPQYVIGAHSIIVAQVGISGSCRIGRGVVLAGQVGVADHVTVGDGAQIGAQSGVHRDVPAGAAVIGTPAMPADVGAPGAWPRWRASRTCCGTCGLWGAAGGARAEARTWREGPRPVGERTTDIHPTAVVHPGARLGPGVRVGPFAVIGQGVCLGEDVEIGPHVVLEGPLELGARCQIHVGAVIGLPPQDLKWKPGTPSGVRIGEGTVVREYATIHRATTPDGCTVLGRDCHLMAQGHVAHDCQIGDDVIMTGYTGSPASCRSATGP